MVPSESKDEGRTAMAAILRSNKWEPNAPRRWSWGKEMILGKDTWKEVCRYGLFPNQACWKEREEKRRCRQVPSELKARGATATILTTDLEPKERERNQGKGEWRTFNGATRQGIVEQPMLESCFWQPFARWRDCRRGRSGFNASYGRG